MATATLVAPETSATAPTHFVEADGNRYAYRRFGAAVGVPLVFLNHFTANLDMWDPAITDGLGAGRPVVLFDDTGVGRSSGEAPTDAATAAGHVVAFITALGLKQVDLFGFSMGGIVAQVVAAEHPELVRKVILVGTGPEGGEGIDGLGALLERATKASEGRDLRLHLFFNHTPTSEAAGHAFLKREAQRTADRHPASSQATIGAHFQTIVGWAKGSAAQGIARLKKITQPVYVVNGKHDEMFPASNSYVLFHELPNAQLTLYADASHGSFIQYGEDFVNSVERFLGR